MIHLQNKKIKVEIAALGAEIKSLYSFAERREYIWEGDPKYWSRSSPILFPIVGAIREGAFLFEGKRYYIPKHGFARDLVFEIVEANAESATFHLSSNNVNIDYPFEFDFIIRYTLNDNTLICNYTVMNKSDCDMYFSLGAHPAFKLDFTEGKTWTDYFLEFEADSRLERKYLVDSLLGLSISLVELKDSKLELNSEMFIDDAWVLQNLKSEKVNLKNDSGDYNLELKFSDFPYFGLWSVPGSSFLCLEPWCGVNDSKVSGVNIEEKEGIILLSPTEIWERNWSISINYTNK